MRTKKSPVLAGMTAICYHREIPEGLHVEDD